MDKLLYTKRETAKLLSISEDTLDQLRRSASRCAAAGPACPR